MGLQLETPGIPTSIRPLTAYPTLYPPRCFACFPLPTDLNPLDYLPYTLLFSLYRYCYYPPLPSCRRSYLNSLLILLHLNFLIRPQYPSYQRFLGALYLILVHPPSPLYLSSPLRCLAPWLHLVLPPACDLIETSANP